MDAIAEAGDEAVKAFVKDGSSNYDESGFFSIQVIASALAVWDLTISPIRSSDKRIQEARADACSQTAFICNLEQHWFTLRRFGGSKQRWYNLDSTKAEPEYVTETYLSLFINQLELDGYSIFVLGGELEPSPADRIAFESPIPPPGSTRKPKRSDELAGKSKASNSLFGQAEMTEDDMLQQALALSRGEDNLQMFGNKTGFNFEEDDQELKDALAASLKHSEDQNKSLLKAIAESMKDFDSPSIINAPASSSSSGVSREANPTPNVVDAEVIRLKRLKKFDSGHK